jgi:hypothetical protein
MPGGIDALMPSPDARKNRRERHAREVEESQKQLRESIAKTNRLLDDSERMLNRHRQERDDADE